jgi:hypothetical protein
MTKLQQTFYLQVSLKGLGYLMREIRNFVLIGTSHQQQKQIDILKQKISKEGTAGRASGTFEESPFPNIQVSPFGLVPKKNKGEFRVIHHLSYPENESINSGIPESKCTVKYQTIEDAVKLMKCYGKGCLLSKTDIQNSFKIIPIHPDDHELLGFSLGDQYYFDRTLPMGLSLSWKLFETFSTAVHWIIDHKLGGSGCVHILDDFLFVGPANSPLCLQTLEKHLTMSKQIGLPIKADTTVFPTTTLTFLGLELDSELMEIRLRLDKLGNLKDQLNHFKFKKKATLR